MPFVNCRHFMYLVISLLVLRAGCGICLYQFLIIAYLFNFQLSVKHEVPLRSQTFSHSLHNVTLVLAILSFTSSSKCSALDIVLPLSLSIYCDGWLIVVLSRCLLVHYLSFFQVDFKLLVVSSLYKSIHSY